MINVKIYILYSLENIENRKSVEYRKKTGIKLFSCTSEQLTEQELDSTRIKFIYSLS